MPDFTVIAGPNGAGKSTFSKRLSAPGALVFDADIIKAIKERQYPDLPIQSIEMMIDSAYYEIEEISIGGKNDLTVETNLRDDFWVTRSLFFKNEGYFTNLIFMLLPDVKTSIDRVNARVDRKGHYVDVESINYNFEFSLKTLKQHFMTFDNLLLFDSTSTDNEFTTPNMLLTLKNSSVDFLDPDAPQWAKPIIDEIVQKITIH